MNRATLSEVKRCSTCRIFKAVGAFSHDKKALDGLKSQCRVCANAVTKKWREANPEKWKAARRGWKVANPDKVRAIHRNTSHKRYRQKKGGLSATDLLGWEQAQQKVCHWCAIKCSTSWHVDHRLPLAKGGAHELHNLVIACPGCNMRKGARDPIEFAQSLGMLL